MGRLFAQGHFGTVHAINRRVARRSAAQRQHPALRDKPEMHQLTLDLLREFQRSQGRAGSNGELAQSS